MSPTEKTHTGAGAGAGRTRTTEAAKARCEQNAQAIERVAKSLQTAQDDLSSIGGSIGAGVGDLRKDVARLLRDANRDIRKMGVATRRDLERLQKDLVASARGDGAAAGARARGTGAGRKRARAASTGEHKRGHAAADGERKPSPAH